MTRAEDQSFAGVRRLGLFGGSFDPVHVGHLHVAQAAWQAGDLERIVFVPAARPPHKPDRVLAEGAERVEMVELAIADRPEYSVSALELERSGPSYTVDTLRELPARLGLDPECELRLIIGWDNLVGLDRWREVEAVFELAAPLVVLREGVPEAILEHLRERLPGACYERLEAGLVRGATVDVSSTELRERLVRGEDVGDLVPANVGEYLARRGIYSPSA